MSPAPLVEPRRGTQVAIKYGIDRIVAVVLLLLLSPLLALVALLIKLSDGGPVLFVHERNGHLGEPFRAWKFRTMIVDADRFLTADGRPTRRRVTRVGRLLRRSSLDELPQLVNIARGEMSLVGPRPSLREHLDRYTDEQLGRFRMRPGVTGLAQVKGRNRLPWSERIRLDNEYIDNYSLRLDASILLETVRVVLAREGIAADRNPGEVDDLGPPRAERPGTG